MPVLDPHQTQVLDRRAGTPARMDADRKQELGQFLTPEGIASLMASWFESTSTDIRLLDAGAGDGALISAFVKLARTRKIRPKRITVTAYELDERIVPALKRTLDSCRVECSRSGIDFSAKVYETDFIEAAVPLVRHDLFGASQAPFNTAILNPPYRKINSDSRTRRLLREAGIETSNLYTGFIALAAKLLCDGGEMVAICPRSFCNGPYFKPFRQQFLDSMALRRVHLFESRSKAFHRDEVLQENIIVSAIKSPRNPKSVVISTSGGAEEEEIAERVCPYVDVVSVSDPDLFIHLVTGKADEMVRERMASFTTPLTKLGLEVSTGRVVDFRAKEFIVAEAENETAPLIYPSHFNGGFVHWPKPGGRKPNAIRDTERTQQLLVAGAIYVLVKRFSSKEERRRVVACIYDSDRIQAERVGFENHLNYFHAHGRGLTMDLAKGLSAFLNSTLLDRYFRQFNGHTQVNATDLRNLRYPTRAQLESLGRKIGDLFPEQGELDNLVEMDLLNGS